MIGRSPLRSSVEAHFGELVEIPSHFYCEIAEEVLWTRDALTPGGRTYRMTFSFGESQDGHPYVISDFWWDSPLLSSMVGKELTPRGDTSCLFTDDEVRLFKEKVESEVLAEVDQEHDQQVARCRRNPELMERLRSSSRWEVLRPYLEKE